LIVGTLPGACYAGGISSFLFSKGIRIFDYAKFAEPLRERIRDCAQEVSKAAGIEIDHVSKSHIRKEDLVARVLEQRGDTLGLVHVLSAMEACPSYKPWHNKANGKTYLRGDTGKCLHCYFYFQDEDLGLCYMRVPDEASGTTSPLQVTGLVNGKSYSCSLVTVNSLGSSSQSSKSASKRVGVSIVPILNLLFLD
jgi:hypothetical protein